MRQDYFFSLSSAESHRSRLPHILIMVLAQREKRREYDRESRVVEETDVCKNVFIALTAFSTTGGNRHIHPLCSLYYPPS